MRPEQEEYTPLARGAKADTEARIPVDETS
jgi:hypothetical protein